MSDLEIPLTEGIEVESLDPDRNKDLDPDEPGRQVAEWHAEHIDQDQGPVSFDG